MYKDKKIGLVIPAYNEQRLIKPTLKNVPKLIDRVYVVNDASTDKMVSVVKEIMKKDRRILLIHHKKNQGVGQGIITGYLKAYEDGMDIAVVVGGDYQMDLSEVTKFLDPIADGVADYTKGNRWLYSQNMNEDMPFMRRLGNMSLSFMAKLASGYWRIFDSNDGYTAISREAIGRVNWQKVWRGYGYCGDWLARFNVLNLRVKDIPRRPIYLPGERQSQISIFKYARKVGPHMLKMFVWRLKSKYLYRDFHPCIFFYFFSAVLILLGMVESALILLSKFSGGRPTSNTVILAAILLIVGFQSLGFAVSMDMQDNEKLQP